MKFLTTAIYQMFVIELEPQSDERGFFARSWCRQQFVKRGLNGDCVQCNVSFNSRRGTLRGLHYQTHPHQEAKVVRVIRGSVHDVVLDLRPHSPSYRAWAAVELSGDNRRMLYVPEGCAHGFLTLTDASEVLYQMSAPYSPQASKGVRWNDPLLKDAWPFEPEVISDRDQKFADVA